MVRMTCEKWDKCENHETFLSQNFKERGHIGNLDAEGMISKIEKMCVKTVMQTQFICENENF
jgi:hypothetical protein